ncbi:hypothetical protein [Thauera sp.]|uniref:hypothetical protein n=1 Tax=Thauera sp. TaxID=1905334 RepID=UPI0039E4F4E3
MCLTIGIASISSSENRSNKARAVFTYALEPGKHFITRLDTGTTPMLDISIPKIENKWWMQGITFYLAFMLSHWLTRSVGFDVLEGSFEASQILVFLLCFASIQKVIRTVIFLIVLVVKPSLVSKA